MFPFFPVAAAPVLPIFHKGRTMLGRKVIGHCKLVCSSKIGYKIVGGSW